MNKLFSMPVLWRCRKYFYMLDEDTLRKTPVLVTLMALICAMDGRLDEAKEYVSRLGDTPKDLKFDNFRLLDVLRIKTELVMPYTRDAMFFRIVFFIVGRDELAPVRDLTLSACRPSILNGFRDFTRYGRYLEQNKQLITETAVRLYGSVGEKVYETLIEQEKDMRCLFVALALQMKILMMNSLPTATEAGTYCVYYKVVGDRNHNDTETVKINVTVSKAVPSYQAPTDISAACGVKLSAVQLPIGFEWTDEDVTLEAVDTETGIQIIKKAKYVPKDTKNYEEVTDIAITIQVTHDSEVRDAVDPTCTSKGYSGDTCCKHCGTKLQSGADVDALDHEFSKDFTVDTEATCKSVGSKSRHCNRCEEKTEITEIPKSDHAWNDGKITKEATETIPKKDAVTTQQPTEESTVSQSPKNGGTITDNKSNAKYTVTDTVKMNVTYSAPITIKAKTITIPATIKINGEIYKVTRIDKNAFKGNKKVTKIVVGSNIQSIGNYAFSGCKKLKTIIIRSKKLTTKTVPKKAFKGIAKKVVVKVRKKKRTAYKKLLKKKGLSSKNRIKNY